MKLDLSTSQIVVCYGYNCIIRHIDRYHEQALLEFPNGEKRWVDFEDLVEENDLVNLEEDWVEDDDRHPEDYDNFDDYEYDF